jgi:hypothetical protein
MTADSWIGPKIAAMHDVAEFERKYFQRLYGNSFAAADTQQMAVLLATNPAFAKAMKAFADKRSSLEGTPIRTTLTVESVSGTEQPQGESPSSGGIMGGLLRKARRQDNAAANRSELMTSTLELIKASPTSSVGDVEIPGGFKQR